MNRITFMLLAVELLVGVTSRVCLISEPTGVTGSTMFDAMDELLAGDCVEVVCGDMAATLFLSKEELIVNSI